MTRAPLTPNAWLRYDLIGQFLEKLSGRRSFLEIGCGQGALATYLVDRFEYVGFEPDKDSFRVARARVGTRGMVHNAFLPEVPYRSFDLVGAFEVLEHIEDDERALELWIRWLNPGGWLLLSVPAGPGRLGACDRMVGHYRRYTRDQMACVLQRAGFAEVRVRSCGFPLGYALEAARNRIARTRQVGSYEDRTAASGRLLQPGSGLSAVTRLFTAPFRFAQRPFQETELGTGIVAFARRPISR